MKILCVRYQCVWYAVHLSDLLFVSFYLALDDWVFIMSRSLATLSDSMWWWEERVYLCVSDRDEPDVVWCMAVKCWARGVLNPLFCGCVLQRSKLGRANLTRYLHLSFTAPSGAQVHNYIALLYWGQALSTFFYFVSFHLRSLLLSLLPVSQSSFFFLCVCVIMFYDIPLSVFPSPKRQLLGLLC